MSSAQQKQPDVRTDQDIFECLISEHSVVATLMDNIQETIENRDDSRQDKRRELFQELAQELLLHAKAEQLVVYPSFEVVNEELAEHIREAAQEHALVEQLVMEIRSMDADDEMWSAKFKVLKDLV